VNIGKTKKVDLRDRRRGLPAQHRRGGTRGRLPGRQRQFPDTPGLRLLQNVDSLRPLLNGVRAKADEAAGRHVPLLVKIAPDLLDSDIDDIAALALDLKLDGIVATNTTITRSGLTTDAATVMSKGVGGLSGAPLKQRSLEVLRRLRAAAGDDLAIISVGGVETAGDVLERLDAGATLVQGYTALPLRRAPCGRRGSTEGSPGRSGTARRPQRLTRGRQTNVPPPPGGRRRHGRFEGGVRRGTLRA
jgi:dihydroorotate dehydrogenase